MAYVGEPYTYDVFFSYSYAESVVGSDLVKRWTQKLIDSIRGPLAYAINGLREGEFRYCLDRDHITPGRLTDQLKIACETSAVMVLFVSPDYLHKEWCLKELQWFLDKAKEDGRGVDHCIAVEIQTTKPEDWPADLRDSAGLPLLAHRVTDRGGQPLALYEFDAGDALKGWGEKVSGITADIKTKLTDLRQRRDASASYRAARPDVEAAAQPAPLPPVAPVRPAQEQPTAVRPSPPAPAAQIVVHAPPLRPNEPAMLYLDADPADVPVWLERRTSLEDTADALVLPDVEDDAPVQLAGSALLEAYKCCDGVALLRGNPDEGIQSRLKGAIRDKKFLLAERKAIRLAVLDEQGGAPFSLAQFYRIPVIPTNDPGWPQALINVLRPIEPPSS